PPVVPPPVAKVLTARKYTSPFFFSSTALADQVIAPVELVLVFRQQDPEFIRVLDRIRLGDGSEELLRVVNDRVGAPSREDSVIVLTPTNAGADTINISQMDRLPGECQEYVGVITGKLNLEEDSLPSPLHLRLKVNARVMFTKNDQQHRWVNGSLGTVTNLVAVHRCSSSCFAKPSRASTDTSGRPLVFQATVPGLCPVRAA